jgi:hypothetical protein
MRDINWFDGNDRQRHDMILDLPLIDSLFTSLLTIMLRQVLNTGFTSSSSHPVRAVKQFMAWDEMW